MTPVLLINYYATSVSHNILKLKKRQKDLIKKKKERLGLENNFFFEVE